MNNSIDCYERMLHFDDVEMWDRDPVYEEF
jgi:hypothetical protein